MISVVAVGRSVWMKQPLEDDASSTGGEGCEEREGLVQFAVVAGPTKPCVVPSTAGTAHERLLVRSISRA